MAKAKKLPSGNWNIVIYIGKDEAGKRIYKSFTGPDKKSVIATAANYYAQKKKPVSLTLGKAWDLYIESKTNILSTRTLTEYKRLRRAELQGIMDIPLADLTQEMVQIEINKAALAQSPKSVRNTHGVLSAVLKIYHPDLRLTTTLPPKAKPTIYVPGDAEIKQLIAAISNEDLLNAVLLAAFGSLRRGEICALTSSDVRGNFITVDKSMVKNEQGAWIIKQPKSYAGYRVIEMPVFVIDRINGKVGNIVQLSPDQITCYFGRLVRKAMPVAFRFHDLRHYQASILHAMGIPNQYIMERGGWKTESTLTRVYQHTMQEKSKDVAVAANSYFTSLMQNEMQNTPEK